MTTVIQRAAKHSSSSSSPPHSSNDNRHHNDTATKHRRKAATFTSSSLLILRLGILLLVSMVVYHFGRQETIDKQPDEYSHIRPAQQRHQQQQLWTKPLKLTKQPEPSDFVSLTGRHFYQDGSVCTDSTSTKCWVHFPVPISFDPEASEQKSVRSQRLCSDTGTCVGTLMGRKGIPFNQDRVVVLEQALHDKPSQHKILALFDGHGDLGHVSSETALLDVPFGLWQRCQQQNASSEEDRLTRCITQAFLETDKGPIATVPSSGTTALVLYQIGSIVAVASAGDSTAFVATYDPKTQQATLVLQAVHHKPADPEERARIEGKGYVQAREREILGPSRC